jgi:hypothetical protein
MRECHSALMRESGPLFEADWCRYRNTSRTSCRTCTFSLVLCQQVFYNCLHVPRNGCMRMRKMNELACQDAHGRSESRCDHDIRHTRLRMQTSHQNMVFCMLHTMRFKLCSTQDDCSHNERRGCTPYTRCSRCACPLAVGNVIVCTLSRIHAHTQLPVYLVQSDTNSSS